MHQDTLRDKLMAFADGELDPDQMLEVMQTVADDPQAARAVLHQQQLRQAVSKTLRTTTSTPSAVLRSSVERLFDEAPDHEQETDKAVVGRIERSTWQHWVPAAVAAVLLISSLGVLMQSRTISTRATPPAVIHQAKAQMFAKRHVTCSQKIGKLHQIAGLSSDIRALPESAGEFLGGGTLPHLDLASVGYQFAGVGRCSVPGEKAIHLVYKADKASGRNDSVSLWIAPVASTDLAVEANKLYRINPESAAHPIIVWRHGGMAYYLVGDSPEPLEKAAKYLQDADSV